jgi:allene oxide cyclase
LESLGENKEGFMQRNFRLGLAVAAVASLALAMAGAVSASESSHGNLTVVEEALTDTEVPATPDVTGNILTFHNELFNKTGTKHVGSDRGDCTRINPDEFSKGVGTWECRWTNFLPGGQITVEGPFNDNSDTVVSITGGTGVYSQARGQMLLQSVAVTLPDGSTDQDYNFVFQFGQNGD